MAPRQNETDTDWSLVRTLDDEDEGTRGDAWARLCSRYRPIMVAFVRTRLRGAGSQATPEDVVQAFLTACVEKRWMSRADRDLGRFRVFARVLLERFTRDWLRKEGAQKRRPPGGVRSLGDRQPQARAEAHAVTARLESDWLLGLVEAALERVRRRSATNAIVIEMSMHAGGLSTADVAVRLGIGSQRAAMLALRGRRMFAEAVWEEVKQATSDPRERAARRHALVRTLAPYLDARRSPSFFERTRPQQDEFSDRA